MQPIMIHKWRTTPILTFTRSIFARPEPLSLVLYIAASIFEPLAFLLSYSIIAVHYSILGKNGETRKTEVLIVRKVYSSP